MWKRISLRKRLYLLLSTLVIITLGGGLVMVWYTYQMEHLLRKITTKDLAAFRVAESKLNAIVIGVPAVETDFQIGISSHGLSL